MALAVIASSLGLTPWSYTDYHRLRGQFSTIQTVTCSPLHITTSTRWLQTFTLPVTACHTLVTNFMHNFFRLLHNFEVATVANKTSYKIRVPNI